MQNVLRLKKRLQQGWKIDGAPIKTCLGCADSLAWRKAWWSQWRVKMIGASSSCIPWNRAEKGGADAENSPVDRTGSAKSPAADPHCQHLHIIQRSKNVKNYKMRFSFRIWLQFNHRTYSSLKHGEQLSFK